MKDNKDYFQVLTNLDLTKYKLDRNINYNVFKIDGSVDEYLDGRIDTFRKNRTYAYTLPKEEG